MLHFRCDTVLLHVGKKTQRLNLCPTGYYSHNVHLKQDFGCYLECHFFRSDFWLNHCCTVLPWKCCLSCEGINLWSGFQYQFPRCFVSSAPHPPHDPVLSVWPGFVLPAHMTQFGLPVWPSFVLPEWSQNCSASRTPSFAWAVWFVSVTQFCFTRMGDLELLCRHVTQICSASVCPTLVLCVLECVPHFCPVRVRDSLLSCELDTGTSESMGKLLNIKPEHMLQFWHLNRTQVLQRHTHAKRELMREPECIP